MWKPQRLVDYEQTLITQGKEKEAFLTTIAAVTDLELFDLYCRVAVSDDWEGEFSEMQAWKRDVSRVALNQRLAKRT